MPNHYDIDIYCDKCGDYMYSFRDKDPREGKRSICKKCRKKIKNRRQRKSIEKKNDGR